MNRLILTMMLGVLLVGMTFGFDFSLGPGLSIKNAFLYLILVAFTIETAVRRNRRFELPSVLVPFGLFVGYCLISWFTTGFVVQLPNYEPLITFITLKSQRIDHLIVFLLFFYGVSSSEDAIGLLRVFLWMVVVGNLLTVVDGFNIPDLGIIQQREDGRLGGPMGESNQYGAYLALTFPAVVSLMWDSQTKKWLAISASFISVLALLATGSRGAFAGLILGSVFATYFLRSFISLRQVALGAIASIAGVVIILAVFLSTDLFGDYLQQLVERSTGSKRDVTAGRSQIWATAFNRMLEHPWSFLTGFGWEAYEYMRGFYKSTHNVYLNIMFHLGLPGLLLYLALMYNIFATCRRAILKATGMVRTQLVAFVLGFAALNVSLFFVELYKPWIYIWAYVGIILRISVESIRSSNCEVAEESQASPYNQRNNLEGV